jgi:hypothetical protein
VEYRVTEPTGLDAALAQGTRNAGRIAGLDAAVAGLAAKLADLGTAVQAVQGTITDQAEVLRSVDGLKETVDELAHRFNALFPDGEDAEGAFYSPIPTPRFWQLSGEDRQQAIGRLRSWVRDVYRPTFGHLAAKLPACWEQHTFCLTVLDVASELHAVLYLQATRNQGLLAGQAELLTRLMPALAALLVAEGARCPHAQSGNGYAANGARRAGHQATALPALAPGAEGRG